MLKYKVIAVDIDDTLVDSKNTYPEIEWINKRAIWVLQKYWAKGGKIILWTLRAGSHLKLALDVLAKNGLVWDAVNANVQEKIDEWEARYPNMPYSPKIAYDLCIDDKNYGVHSTGINWNAIGKEILKEID